MINALKYIKKLEQAGFPRAQAEIQVQLVLEVIEGELVTKHDLLATEQRLDHRIDDLIKKIDHRFEKVDHRFEDFENRMDHRFIQFEYRIITKMSVIIVSTMTLFVAILGFIVKP